MATGQSDSDWKALLASAGPYPLEAFAFVRDGLSHTVEHVHRIDERSLGGSMARSSSGDDEYGPTKGHHGLTSGGFNPGSGPSGSDATIPANGNSDPQVESDPDAQPDDGSGAMVTGMNSDSRHVSGQQLCLGLRDYAIKRYGMMAPAVLRSWNLRRTDDFGRIVFAMIEHGLMSKTAEDTLEDFQAVYDFDEAFARETLMRHVGRS
ncbi:MAG: hypothetical protein JNL80_07085 [Phycisphaerae bacterium]|nr:hypothetical protein [Phycisphaerae bacterium]